MLASNTSPKVLTSRSSLASSSHSAAARCSSSRTARRSGNSRRTVARRTHGTDSNASRARSRSSDRKLPASLLFTAARTVSGVLCARSPSSVMPRSVNVGRVASHHIAPATITTPSSVSITLAPASARRTSNGSGVTAAARAIAISLPPSMRGASSREDDADGASRRAEASSIRHSCS